MLTVSYLSGRYARKDSMADYCAVWSRQVLDRGAIGGCFDGWMPHLYPHATYPG